VDKKCPETTKTGKPCRGKVGEGETYCNAHKRVGGGRPRLDLTDDQVKQVTKLVALGINLELVAAYLEMSYATLHRRAQEIPEIQAAVEKGKALGAIRATSKLAELIEQGVPSAIFFYLKTQHGWREVDKMKVEHSGPNGAPIQHEHEHTHDLSKLSDEELVELDRLNQKTLVANPSRN
jgi:hypothetical protein